MSSWRLKFENVRSTTRAKYCTFLAVKNETSISNPNLLSSSETGVNPGIRSWKKHLSDWARCQKASGGIYSTKKRRPETLQPGLEFDNFKPRLESCIFKCISWLNGSFFGGWWSRFSERGSQDLSNGTNSPLNPPIFFCVFTSIFCGCSRQQRRRKCSLKGTSADVLRRGLACLFGIRKNVTWTCLMHFVHHAGLI
jgi:hypothetical protein